MVTLYENRDFAGASTTLGEGDTQLATGRRVQRLCLSPSVRRMFVRLGSWGEPLPGGPTNSSVCPPTAAISSARRAVS
jgi:hypothetical protein